MRENKIHVYTLHCRTVGQRNIFTGKIYYKTRIIFTVKISQSTVCPKFKMQIIFTVKISRSTVCPKFKMFTVKISQSTVCPNE